MNGQNTTAKNCPAAGNGDKSVKNSQSGNAMFYILIAIALLVALSYAVSQGSRGSVTSMSRDRARLFAGEIIAYGDAVAQAAQILRLRGVTPQTLNFNTAGLTGYNNPACGAAESCAIYNPAGGAVNYTKPPVDWLQSDFAAQAEYQNAFITGATCVPQVGTGTATCASDGVDNEELVLFVPFVKPEICKEINDLLGIANPSDAPPVQGSCPWATKFTGSFAAGQIISAPGMTGQTAGCFRADSGCATMPDSYHFYQVLVAR